jgi:hypothetical protein
MRPGKEGGERVGEQRLPKKACSLFQDIEEKGKSGFRSRSMRMNLKEKQADAFDPTLKRL